MINEINNKIKGSWMLQKEFRSPWKTVIVPLFLNFDDTNHVVSRGYGDGSVSRLTYSLNDEKLKIGDKINCEIVAITLKKMVLKIDDEEYNYYRLLEESLDPDPKKLKAQLIKSKWLIDDNSYEFTNDPILNNNNSFEVIKYRDGKTYFGTYFIDTFKNNLLLVMLIDGKPLEKVFKVIEGQNSELKLETASGETLKLIKQ